MCAGDRFTILTRETEGCMTGIHPRMSLILYKKNRQKGKRPLALKNKNKNDMIKMKKVEGVKR